MESSNIEAKLLNVREAAAYLGLAHGTVYHLISEKRIPVIHLSRRCVRFRRADLDRWLDVRTRPANEEY